VPTRAATITGRYAHEVGAWDNAFPYTGVPRGWGHYFREQGVCLTTIGKLDFQPGVDHGIEDERLALHRESLDIHPLFRDQEIQPRFQFLPMHRATGPADSMDAYAKDIRVAEEAARWLAEERPSDRPWVLMVHFNDLHRPWRPPRDLWEHYDPRVRTEDLDERFTEDRSRLHPYHRTYARHHLGEHLDLHDVRRALVGYHASCEVLDRNVGRVLRALDETGLREETLIIYSADHGGTCGEHRNWDHGAMYDESIRIPLIFAGPRIRAGLESTAVSALDVLPTVCEAVGAERPAHVRGTSLLGLLRGEKDAPRPAFSLTEYHANGFPGSVFAVRSGPYKFVECVGERPMLFNLEEDPHEMRDLALDRPEDPEVKATIQRLRKMLCEVCSPEAVDERAKADQGRLRQELRESGRLFEEMWKRGYERNPDRLIHRPEFLP
jgi:choline-sulfatase